MCEPTTIAAAIGAGAALAGTGVSIAGQQTQSAEEQRVASFNAARAEEEASRFLVMGEQQASRVEQEGRATSGTAKAVVAASNLTGGSLENLFAVSEANAAADAALLRQQAGEQAQALDFEAEETRRRARASKQAGLLGSIGTGIAGFGGAASSIIRSAG